MAACGAPTAPKCFVLCFDGTGNKFSGTDSDSNILKIYRMLDRTRGQQYHYYQPGIGTYTTSTSLSHTSRVARIYSWYQKSLDSMVGNSFDAHVMGGYKFLMRYYSPGDDIYFFGFSRGAYIARFLAEMLDYIGLLSAGNEELIRFAWKTFARWQQRYGEDDDDRKRKKELFRYMKAFRETFSRPVRRIRFLGLFDTVNSVPRFETAWMRRGHLHPYTARSSAKVIRQAVAIDERRAKFRQDLISESKRSNKQEDHQNYYTNRGGPNRRTNHNRQSILPSIVIADGTEPLPTSSKEGSVDTSSTRHEEERYRSRTPDRRRGRDFSLAVPIATSSNVDLSSLRSPNASRESSRRPGPRDGSNARAPFPDDDDELDQDIREIWFPGSHADIGGGWSKFPGEAWPLSHTPLVWMVQEAEKAGLKFDRQKMKEMMCCEEDQDEEDGSFDPNYTLNGDPVSNRSTSAKDFGAPITLAPNHPSHIDPPDSPSTPTKSAADSENNLSPFLAALISSQTKSHLHDTLSYKNSTLPLLTVLSWRLMEYLPFQRMDLQSDGTWRPIRWPLPKGEVRDIPATALIHNSALKRMHTNRKYRPGNLIVGGAGGRGVKRAPEEFGTGSWIVWGEEGDPVKEFFVRRGAVCVGEKGQQRLVSCGRDMGK